MKNKSQNASMEWPIFTSVLISYKSQVFLIVSKQIHLNEK